MLVILSATVMLVDYFVAIMQVKVSAANICATTFIEIIHVTVSVAIMWVYFLQYLMPMTISIVIIQVTVSVVAMYVTASSSNFIFFSQFRNNT